MKHDLGLALGAAALLGASLSDMGAMEGSPPPVRKRRKLTKGQRTFIKQSRAMLYNMSTSAGARDGLRWQEYRAAVKAQSAAGLARMAELAEKRANA